LKSSGGGTPGTLLPYQKCSTCGRSYKTTDRSEREIRITEARGVLQELGAEPALSVDVTPKPPGKPEAEPSDQRNIGQIDHRTKPSQRKLQRDIDLPALGQKQQDLSHYFNQAKLTELQRDVLSLKLEYGWSVTDIAKRLGLHRTTVDEHLKAGEKKINRARARERQQKNWAKNPR
jgi:DNA-directed RNA polymerase specialized sigma24 family protein